MLQRIFPLVLLLLAFLLIIATASANPPSDLKLTYNQTTGNLSAAFTHMVSDPGTHFLKTVKIALNGNQTTNEYSSQPTPESFTYVYHLNATNGTFIDLIGECNIFGSIERTITV